VISQVLKTTTMSIGLGFLAQIFQSTLKTTYLNNFLSENLITILIALLAINSATLGIVLTKIRDLVEKHVKEQISLIIVSVIFLTVNSSNLISNYDNIKLLFDSITVAIFAYSLFVLYDTAKSVLIIIDFNVEENG
jgi:hypothetical protein